MKSKSLYRDILKNSFDITFKNKILWFFGLFAAPLMGMAEYEIIIGSSGGVDGMGSLSGWYQVANTVVLQSKLLLSNPIASLILLIILSAMALFVFFLIWIAIVAQCALIDSIDKINSKILTGSKINNSISSGTKDFFPILGVHFLVKIIITVSLFLLSLPIITIVFGSDTILSGTFYFIFSLIFIPITAITIFTSKYAINYIVIEKESLFEGIKKGYRMFVDNWLITIEMSFILFFISIMMGIFIALIGSFIILPLMLLIYIFIQMRLVFLTNFVLILGLLLLIITTIFLVAIFSTFQYGNWVLLFNRLKESKGKEKGKLARWFSFER